jgi:hypothetical protein
MGHAERGFNDMNDIGAKDGKDLKDAAGCRGGWAGLAEGAGCLAWCTPGGRAEGGQAMQMPSEIGVREGAIGLLRPLKAGYF